jgi:hypothetical protein
MTKSHVNAIRAKHSSRESARDRERVNPTGKQYDFSSIQEYLSEGDTLDYLVKTLREARASYLELSLYALMENFDLKTLKVLPHEQVQGHADCLATLANLLENLKS